MIRKKVAVVGAFAVGKTSLVQRFVSGIFSARYLTTVGVKIDKRDCTVDDRQVTLVIWDLEGEDGAHGLRLSHVRGSSGVLVVADGTRPATFEAALRLGDEIDGLLGPVPRLLLLNKADLRDAWQLEDSAIAAVRADGQTVLETSAKAGTAVAAAFDELARRMLA